MQSNGWYPLYGVIEWYIDNKGPNKENSARVELSGIKLSHETRLKEAQAEAAELKNAVAKGEYVKRDDVVSELQRFLLPFEDLWKVTAVKLQWR